MNQATIADVPFLEPGAVEHLPPGKSIVVGPPPDNRSDAERFADQVRWMHRKHAMNSLVRGDRGETALERPAER
jgi:hypothetical protein